MRKSRVDQDKQKKASFSDLLLEELMEELNKKIPDEVKIQNLMSLMGIPYFKDPIKRLDQVLSALNAESDLEELRCQSTLKTF